MSGDRRSFWLASISLAGSILFVAALPGGWLIDVYLRDRYFVVPKAALAFVLAVIIFLLLRTAAKRTLR